MDSRIGFRYNPQCSLQEVDVALGPIDGEATLSIRGTHLGMGDESVLVNGRHYADAGLTKREVEGSNIKALHVRVPTSVLGSLLKPKSVQVSSRRSGKCIWKPQHPNSSLKEKATAATLRYAEHLAKAQKQKVKQQPGRQNALRKQANKL